MPFPSGDTQTCRDCNQELPISKFSRNGRKDGYHRPECRSCQHKRSKKINPRYQQTDGAVAAREAHKGLSRSEVGRIKKLKLRLQSGECIYCTARLDPVTSHLDHRLPLAQGGSNDEQNLQLLCPRCNFEKYAKSHQEYIDWLHEIGEHSAVDRQGKI
jgi:5-methylcytosine-specific restriction endonuclease McrA